MFKHIPVPADGSDNAHRTIAKAIGLPQAFKSQASVTSQVLSRAHLPVLVVRD